MKNCLLCDKPVAPSFATVIVGAVLLGFGVHGWTTAAPEGHCTCQGTRCNICNQVYQGLAGDCLCTDVTVADYEQAGAALGRRVG